MTELLKDYTFGEIISFVVTFAIATKGFVTFLGLGRLTALKKVINKQSQKEKDKEAVEEKIERNAQQIADVAKKQEETKQDINTLTQNINLLIQSDKDSIKAYITKEHHYYCYKQKGGLMIIL